MTQNQPFDRSDLFLSMILIVVMVFLTGAMGLFILSDPGLRSAMKLVVVGQLIQDDYGEPFKPDNLFQSSLDGMFSILDPFSGYVRAKDFDRMEEEMGGAYGGIGVTVVHHQDGLLIMSVRENGPAGKVGLLTGDIIIGADSVSFADKTVSQASDLLRGPAGSSVLIRIFRPATGDTTEVSLKRADIPLIHVPFAGYTAEDMLYIRLLDFDAGSSDEVMAALDSLLPKPGHHPAGVIFDLRGNPGGLFSEGYRTASLFLPKGAFIVGTSGRSRWKDETHIAMLGDMTDGLPMAVLVDRGTASAAEIVSGSLQAEGRAFLVGDTTFGKGLVQGFVSFPDGDGLRLTISRYYVGDHEYLNTFDSVLNPVGKGLIPDYYYAFPELDPYIGALEYSLLLQEFAYRHTPSLLSLATDSVSESAALRTFERFADSSHFDFKSPIREAAQTVVDRAEAHQAGPATRKLAGRVLSLAREADRQLLWRNQNYVITRLRQIAFERQYGDERSYRDVILPNRGDIRLAVSLLEQRQQ